MVQSMSWPKVTIFFCLKSGKDVLFLTKATHQNLKLLAYLVPQSYTVGANLKALSNYFDLDSSSISPLGPGSFSMYIVFCNLCALLINL